MATDFFAAFGFGQRAPLDVGGDPLGKKKLNELLQGKRSALDYGLAADGLGDAALVTVLKRLETESQGPDFVDDVRANLVNAKQVLGQIADKTTPTAERLRAAIAAAEIAADAPKVATGSDAGSDGSGGAAAGSADDAVMAERDAFVAAAGFLSPEARAEIGGAGADAWTDVATAAVLAFISQELSHVAEHRAALNALSDQPWAARAATSLDDRQRILDRQRAAIDRRDFKPSEGLAVEIQREVARVDRELQSILLENVKVGRRDGETDHDYVTRVLAVARPRAEAKSRIDEVQTAFERVNSGSPGAEGHEQALKAVKEANDAIERARTAFEQIMDASLEEPFVTVLYEVYRAAAAAAVARAYASIAGARNDRRNTAQTAIDQALARADDVRAAADVVNAALAVMNVADVPATEARMDAAKTALERANLVAEQVRNIIDEARREADELTADGAAEAERVAAAEAADAERVAAAEAAEAERVAAADAAEAERVAAAEAADAERIAAAEAADAERAAAARRTANRIKTAIEAADDAMAAAKAAENAKADEKTATKTAEKAKARVQAADQNVLRAQTAAQNADDAAAEAAAKVKAAEAKGSAAGAIEKAAADARAKAKAKAAADEQLVAARVEAENARQAQEAAQEIKIAAERATEVAAAEARRTARLATALSAADLDSVDVVNGAFNDIDDIERAGAGLGVPGLDDYIERMAEKRFEATPLERPDVVEPPFKPPFDDFVIEREVFARAPPVGAPARTVTLAAAPAAVAAVAALAKARDDLGRARARLEDATTKHAAAAAASATTPDALAQAAEAKRMHAEFVRRYQARVEALADQLALPVEDELVDVHIGDTLVAPAGTRLRIQVARPTAPTTVKVEVPADEAKDADEAEGEAEGEAKDAAEDAAKDAAEDVAKDVAKDAAKDAAEDAAKDAAEDAKSGPPRLPRLPEPSPVLEVFSKPKDASKDMPTPATPVTSSSAAPKAAPAARLVIQTADRLTVSAELVDVEVVVGEAVVGRARLRVTDGRPCVRCGAFFGDADNGPYVCRWTLPPTRAEADFLRAADRLLGREPPTGPLPADRAAELADWLDGDRTFEQLAAVRDAVRARSSKHADGDDWVGRHSRTQLLPTANDDMPLRAPAPADAAARALWMCNAWAGRGRPSLATAHTLGALGLLGWRADPTVRAFLHTFNENWLTADVARRRAAWTAEINDMVAELTAISRSLNINDIIVAQAEFDVGFYAGAARRIQQARRDNMSDINRALIRLVGLNESDPRLQTWTSDIEAAFVLILTKITDIMKRVRADAPENTDGSLARAYLDGQEPAAALRALAKPVGARRAAEADLGPWSEPLAPLTVEADLGPWSEPLAPAAPPAEPDLGPWSEPLAPAAPPAQPAAPAARPTAVRASPWAARLAQRV